MHRKLLQQSSIPAIVRAGLPLRFLAHFADILFRTEYVHALQTVHYFLDVAFDLERLGFAVRAPLFVPFESECGRRLCKIQLGPPNSNHNWNHRVAAAQEAIRRKRLPVFGVPVGHFCSI